MFCNVVTLKSFRSIKQILHGRFADADCLNQHNIDEAGISPITENNLTDTLWSLSVQKKTKT